jgi:hypothetical protein
MANRDVGAKEKKAIRMNAKNRKFLEYHSKLSGIPIDDTVNQAVEDWLDVTYPVDIGRLEKAKGLPSTLAPA